MMGNRFMFVFTLNHPADFKTLAVYLICRCDDLVGNLQMLYMMMSLCYMH